jgi:inorganic triphosphatase YgiF
MWAEVEAKFITDDPSVLAALSAAPTLGLAAVGPARAVREVDRYLDTAGGSLASARWACRLRTRDGGTRISLKGPAEVTADDWHHRRPEIEAPATTSIDPADWPESEARQRLAALAGGAALVERFVLLQERTERDVLVEGERVATLSLDVVTILDRGMERGRLLVVELELTSAESLPGDRFEALAATLAARAGLRPDPHTKLEHATALLNLR